MLMFRLRPTDIYEKRDLDSNVSTLYLVSKRVLDIFVSSIALVAMLFVFIIIGAVIKIDSKGPVFFSQERLGQKGRKFKMYKFRSMVKSAESLLESIEDKNEVGDCMFKMRNDPRVTKVGRILRKTSLDELPQFFNVLKGDMSIVGPRPPIYREVLKYEAWHYLRLAVKPGITGLWQVSGRNELGFDEMVRLDLKYIRERNFWYDLKIIIKTIPVLLGDKMAF